MASSHLLPLPLLVALLGCETLLDLGPRAQEQGSAGAGACGFEQSSTSLACVDCLQQRCCDENVACTEDPACAEQQAKLTQCIYNVSCIENVLADAGVNSNINRFSNCATACTLACFPTGECLQLALCCQNLDSIARAGCSETVESADEQRCAEASTTFDCP